MKKSLPSDNKTGRVAFLWDESFLWGIMAYKSLTAAGLPFDLVRAEDIRQGSLKRCSAIFVPGGWASNKIKALRNDGAEEIRRFVHDGGAYVGFCGGAGLATQDGLGLLPVRRRPTKDRVPSFSGRIRLNLAAHPVWEGPSEGDAQSTSQPVFHAWWPSQFVADESVSVLATYGEALPDSFSSDVNVGDAQSLGLWHELERSYGINLDPGRLKDEPAVLEGIYGAGKVFLSLVHFDTPDDMNGTRVLKNIWSCLGASLNCGNRIVRPGTDSEGDSGGEKHPMPDPGLLADLEESVNGLIDFGHRNFLWFRRNPMLLQWRRGVRGLEYCTLHAMVSEIAALLRQGDGSAVQDLSLARIRDLSSPFIEKARQLLLMERFALQKGAITYERCDDPVIQALRGELFSNAKSHGGKFKDLLDALDELLFSLMIRH